MIVFTAIGRLVDEPTKPALDAFMCKYITSAIKSQLISSSRHFHGHKNAINVTRLHIYLTFNVQEF